MASPIVALRTARTTKNDEFYTPYNAVEAELQHYTSHFKDKIVYCNCDDYRTSNFVKYFLSNFKKLGLRKLIATHYEYNDMGLFNTEPFRHGTYFEYTFQDGCTICKLKGDGSFDSPECIEILKSVDIVVTNPPFSLCRSRYFPLVDKTQVGFIILGVLITSIYMEDMIIGQRMWAGQEGVTSGIEFIIPQPKTLTQDMRMGEDGTYYQQINSIAWYTNLDHPQRYTPLELHRTYNPDDYPTYDNYDAIDVRRIKDIPYDYTGMIGVPLTFVQNYSPRQFILHKVVRDAYVNGKRLFTRFLIQKNT